MATVTGVSAVQADIQARVAAYKQRVDDELSYAALNCESYAKASCPVDTGRLRAGNVADVSESLIKTVSNPVTYAPYVEFGTTRQRAQPFFYPAFEQAKSELLDALNGLVV